MRSRADPDDLVAEKNGIHKRLRYGPMWKRRDRTWLEPRRVHYFFRARDTYELGADCFRDQRFVGSPVSGNERDDERAVADHDERLHNLRELAADGLRRVARCRRSRLELLDPRVDPGRPQDR